MGPPKAKAKANANANLNLNRQPCGLRDLDDDAVDMTKGRVADLGTT